MTAGRKLVCAISIVRAAPLIVRFCLTAPSLAQVETVRADAGYVRYVTLARNALLRPRVRRLVVMAERVLPRRLAYRLVFTPLVVGHIVRDVLAELELHGEAMARRGIPPAKQFDLFLKTCLRHPGLPAEDCYLYEVDQASNRRYAESCAHVDQMLTAMALAGRQRAGSDRPPLWHLNTKSGFKELCREAGLPVVPAIALFSSRGVTWAPEHDGLPRRDLFFKPDVGQGGHGARRIFYEAETDRYRVESPFTGTEQSDGRETAPLDADALVEHLRRLSASGDMVLEPRLTNHRDLARLVGSTTLAATRVLTTIDRSGRVELLGGWLRVAIDDCAISNLAAGGLVARIDGATERITGNAWKLFEQWGIERHPQTATPFDGFPVPFMRDIAATCQRGHAAASATAEFAVPLLGWDAVITDDGPCLLECNTASDLLYQRMSAAPFWRTNAFAGAVLSYLEPVEGERIPLLELARPLLEVASRERAAGVRPDA